MGGSGVVLTLDAEEIPLGEGGANDQAFGDFVGGGVLLVPLGDVMVEVGLGFAVNKEEGGGHAVRAGVLAGDGFAFSRVGAGVFVHARASFLYEECQGRRAARGGF